MLLIAALHTVVFVSRLFCLEIFVLFLVWFCYVRRNTFCDVIVENMNLEYMSSNKGRQTGMFILSHIAAIEW